MLDAVGVDTWGTDGVLATEDGVTLGPMYCYRDHRLDGMIDQVKARIEAGRIYEISGIHFQPFNVSNQLLWLAQNRASLLRPGVRYLPAPTLFNFYLGGVTAVDSSWASVTQVMDARKKKWSREILRALGSSLPGSCRPSWRRAPWSGRCAPGLPHPLGIGAAKIVAVGSHDTASAYAAAPVGNASHALIISSGTWSLIGKLVRKPHHQRRGHGRELSNEGGIGNIRLLKNCMGTWLVQELRRVWRARTAGRWNGRR